MSINNFLKKHRNKLCGLLFLGLASFMSVALAEDEGFSIDNMVGEFTFAADGTFVKTTGSILAGTLIAIVGVADFNDDGTCVFDVTINAGIVNPTPTNPGAFSFSIVSSTCTYDVNSEGRGVIQVDYQNPPFPILNLPFVIVNDDEILAIRSDPSIVASGLFKRRSSGDDDDSD